MTQDPRTDAGEYVRQLMEMEKSSLPLDGGSRFNRLIFSQSPYLLQHAENPVNWYQWGDDAFAEARRRNVPVFLSIGYATCHWCHVMAHESFENHQIAALLNREFLSIKVDREERPDIDDTYMKVSQLMTGSGGWPLNVFLTPDRRPFLAITYLPPFRRGGMPGLNELLADIGSLWNSQRERVERNCEQVMSQLKLVSSGFPGEYGEDLPGKALQQLESMYDTEWGGFGDAPKFPMPLYLNFLLRCWRRSGESRLLGIVTNTLRIMRRGGIFDQLGFGFHRYSTDRQWLVPHFEKMLYDQALLASTYLETYQATGDELFRDVAEEIFAFVGRELTDSEGGFYSALDADSEGREGTFYVWKPEEIRSVLGEKAAAEFSRCYGVTEHGNFEGSNILHVPRKPCEAMTQPHVPRPADLEQARQKLLAAREKRVRPLRDGKVVVSWNGLMISAFARGYLVMANPDYLVTADRAARFLLTRMRKGGRLLRSCHGGIATIPAFLEDYASLAAALVDLHQATLKAEYLQEAVSLTEDMLRLFGDQNGGGLFDSGSDAEEVLVRSKSGDDGVMPSGNSLAAMVLVRLARITREERFADAAAGIISSFMGSITRQPAGHLHLLSARELLHAPEFEIGIAGEEGSGEMQALLHTVGRRFLPELVVQLRQPETGGGAVAHVCAAGACRPPADTPGKLESVLDELGRVATRS